MKVGVIGGGASGIITAKTLLSEGIDFDLFELSEEVGGTWIYKENYVDKHGYPIPSSIYKNLKTNIPKELMLFEGMDYNIDGPSYIDALSVLDYLQRFSKKFDLDKYIKYEHLVTKVSREGNHWELKVNNLKSGNEYTYVYDAIFVCNGHYSVPSYPNIVGSGSFPGTVIHSHYYRVPEIFCYKTLLIIGHGASGVDILFDVCPFAKSVYFSHHGPECLKVQIDDDKIIHKPDVRAMDGCNIHFTDGSTTQVDSILYCTGYKYEFPFLDESCEIKIDNNYVYSLYKQIVSIPHNSMFFIGLPSQSFLFQLFELQVKSGINILKGRATLPTREEMERDTGEWEQNLASKGYTKNKYHVIKDYVKEYFNDVASIGNVTPYPDSLFEMFKACGMCRLSARLNHKNKTCVETDSDIRI